MAYEAKVYVVQKAAQLGMLGQVQDYGTRIGERLDGSLVFERQRGFEFASPGHSSKEKPALLQGHRLVNGLDERRVGFCASLVDEGLLPLRREAARAR